MGGGPQLSKGVRVSLSDVCFMREAIDSAETEAGGLCKEVKRW